MNTIEQLLNNINNKIKSLNAIIPLTDYLNRLEQINFQLNEPATWNDQKKSVSLTKERQTLLDLTTKLQSFISDYNFYKELSELDKEECEKENSKLEELLENISNFELKLLMNEENDSNNAIITISAGSGGLESSNFVSIILRMILRYCEISKFKTEIIDLQESEEYSDICINSVVFSVSGEFAYGFCKALHGVYKFIRNSPFSSSDKRHTSFIAIAVEAEVDDNIDIKIEDKDIEITAARSSGSGGQKINKTNSKCIVRHLPTNILIACQTQRDFHSNKKQAMKMLMAKLYKLEEARLQGDYDKYLESLKHNSFANQSFSFTYTPYMLFKDEDSGFKENQIDKVLDGDLQKIIEQRLRFLKNKN